jgi:hypothetical protein
MTPERRAFRILLQRDQRPRRHLGQRLASLMYLIQRFSQSFAGFLCQDVQSIEDVVFSMRAFRVGTHRLPGLRVD